MKEVHLIYNPTAGRGEVRHVLEKINGWANLQKDLKIHIHQTENVGHATSIARDLTTDGKEVTIFVLGGDGTLNEVLNGIKHFGKTTLGILPYGSGNDFARAVGIYGHDPVGLLNEYVNDCPVAKCDYLLLNDKYRAINEVSMGMSAEVVNFRNHMKHFKPETQYKIASTVRAIGWKKFKYTVSFDKGPDKEIDSMWFTMNNGTNCGSGLVIARNSKFTDGLISISYVLNFNRLITLYVLTKVKKGEAHELKAFKECTCKEVDIKCSGCVVEFDGNLIENQKNINVKVIPGKLNLLVPNKK